MRNKTYNDLSTSDLIAIRVGPQYVQGENLALNLYQLEIEKLHCIFLPYEHSSWQFWRFNTKILQEFKKPFRLTRKHHILLV